jgi:ABC-type lipoprotein export system ATPase subunit
MDHVRLTEGFSFYGLSWEAKEGAKAFLNFSSSTSPFICIEAPALVAVIGPSGSGKSVLLHLLAGEPLLPGRPKSSTAHVRINGRHRCAQCWYQHTRMVSQKNSLASWLTCYETLWLESVLVFGKAEKEKLLDILHSLSLDPQATAGNVATDKIYGEEKCTRLAVARALAAQPRILLIDEPASLKDITTFRQLLAVLKTYSHKSARAWTCSRCGLSISPGPSRVIVSLNSIILAIHKDEGLLNDFDKFVFMSREREIVLYSTAEEAIKKFASYSALKRRLETDNANVCSAETEHPPTLNEPWPKIRFKALPQRKWNSVSRTYKLIPQISSRINEIKYLLVMEWYKIAHDPRRWGLFFLQRVLIFILLSFIFAHPTTRGSLLGIFFFIPINQTSQVLLLTFTEGFSGLTELELIRAARFRRAHRAHSALLAKLAILIILNWIPALFYLPAVYFIAAFTRKSNFWLFMLANLLSIAATVPLGLGVASSSQDPYARDRWLFAVSVLVTTFSGIHTAANFQLTWLLRWLQYLSPAFYLFAISLQLEYTQAELSSLLSLGPFILGVGEDFGALAVLAIFYTLLATFALLRTTQPRRLLL